MHKNQFISEVHPLRLERLVVGAGPVSTLLFFVWDWKQRSQVVVPTLLSEVELVKNWQPQKTHFTAEFTDFMVPRKDLCMYRKRVRFLQSPVSRAVLIMATFSL